MIKVLLEEVAEGQTYQQVWDYQEKLLEQNVRAKGLARAAQQSFIEPNNTRDDEVNSVSSNAYEITNRLLFVEHAPVYTLGKSGNLNNVLISEEERQSRGIEFFKINRGGDITFHGPGQLVGYPILDLEQFKPDLGWYLRSLEEVIILTIAHFGLKGERSKGETGVWLDAGLDGRERKICAMGIRCSRWITMHGFALNVNTDLSYFDHIIPCGIVNKQVTSLQKELGASVPMSEVKDKLKENFSRVFDVELRETFLHTGALD